VTRFCSRAVLSIVAGGLFALALLVASGCSSGADNSKALEGEVWKATEIAGVTTVLTEKGAR